MHFVHVLLVFSLGLGCYCSSQWANLDTQSGNNPSLPTSQNSLDDNSGITLHATAHGGGISRPESNSPEVLISNQAEEFQACSSNNDQLPPAKRQIRREWCPYNNDLDPNNLPATNTKPPSSVPEDKPKDGSEPSQLDTSGEKAPSTNINPQLQIFQGVEQLPGKLDSNPCNGPRNNPVCSPFYLSRVWYPLSLVWKATCLDFCRIYYPGSECRSGDGEKLYCCDEVRNEIPAPPGKSLWYYRYRTKYPNTGQGCEALA